MAIYPTAQPFHGLACACAAAEPATGNSVQSSSVRLATVAAPRKVFRGLKPVSVKKPICKDLRLIELSLCILVRVAGRAPLQAWSELMTVLVFLQANPTSLLLYVISVHHFVLRPA